MSAGDKVREIVTDVTGIEWPAGDVGKLRTIANAWRKFADDMEDVAAAADKAAQALIHHNSGEAISAFNDPFWRRYYHDKKGWLQDLVDGPRDLAKGIDQYADAVAGAKKKLDHELEIAGAVIVAGTALAFFTLGATEAAAATATAAIVDLAATVGVALTTEVAAIAGTAFATAAIAGIESVAVDLAVAQPLKIASGLQDGFSLDQASSAATDGMLYGGLFGAGGATARAAGEAGGWGNLLSGAGPRLTLADLAYGPEWGGIRTPLPGGRDPLPGELPPGYDLHQSGGSLRPRDDGSVRAYDRTETWATDAYESFRSADDVDALAGSLQNAPRINGGQGFSRDEIAAVKRHIFEDTHPLTSYDGEIIHARYDPNPDMAEAWVRLRAGRHTDSDLLLFEHELAEHQYYVDHPGAPYSEAHAAANKVANWEANEITPPGREDYNAPWE
ncbi:hypothetical protein ACFVYD_28650 [Streptomyces sp. NPDC058301]|uniref:WXG100-like domain-containing protein n=1 Tax=Streptomyces sp. NPDC058301 TaxID=3346436 RepID=UPI0036E1F160